MFRSSLIYLSKADWARQMVTRWSFARRAASRFIAGETLEEAIQVVQALNQRGINATLDHLGEHTNSIDASIKATQAIIEIIDRIDQSGVRSNVSIKLSQIGMLIDRDVCYTNLRQILSYADEHHIFVRIDMEDSPWVDATLDLFRKMRDKEGLTNTGLVIQAYLYRSEQDIRKLAHEGVKVRLCKGAYKEPANIAFPKKRDVDANYDKLVTMLIDGSKECGAVEVSADGKTPPIPAIATHDPNRIAAARAYAEKVNFPKTAMEFQMLYGIRRDLQDQMAEAGYPVRLYVPYGTEWYPYYVRRLAERPANVWFFVSNFFRK